MKTDSEAVWLKLKHQSPVTLEEVPLLSTPWKMQMADFKTWTQTHFKVKIFYKDGPCLACVLPNREILRHLTHFQQIVPPCQGQGNQS